MKANESSQCQHHSAGLTQTISYLKNIHQWCISNQCLVVGANIPLSSLDIEDLDDKGECVRSTTSTLFSCLMVKDAIFFLVEVKLVEQE